MTENLNGYTAASLAADPSVSAETLAQLAQHRPDLYAAIVAHPNSYPGLNEWIAARQAQAATAAAHPAAQQAEQTTVQTAEPAAAPADATAGPGAQAQTAGATGQNGFNEAVAGVGGYVSGGINDLKSGALKGAAKLRKLGTLGVLGGTAGHLLLLIIFLITVSGLFGGNLFSVSDALWDVLRSLIPAGIVLGTILVRKQTAQQTRVALLVAGILGVLIYGSLGMQYLRILDAAAFIPGSYILLLVLLLLLTAVVLAASVLLIVSFFTEKNETKEAAPAPGA